MTPTLKLRYAETPDHGRLSYYSCGTGPSILVLHGTVSFALTHSELGEALSPYFTVHIASRRGRGLSTGYPQSVTSIPTRPDGESQMTLGHSLVPRTYNPSFSKAVLDTEAADLNTLICATQATFLICVSDGVHITLHSLLTSPKTAPIFGIQKIVLFEPPLFFSDHEVLVDIEDMKTFEEELSRGDTIDAMITAMNLAQLGPGWIPRWLMRGLSSLMNRHQEHMVDKRRKSGADDQGICTMKDLIHLARYDFAILEGMTHSSSEYADVNMSDSAILLLAGSRSPPYLRKAVDVLANKIHNAKVTVIDSAGHELLCNHDMRGQPAKAVPAIKEFFGQ